MINSILHVEDDSSHAKLVKTAFNSFGFSGEMLSAGSVHEALVTLDELRASRSPLSWSSQTCSSRMERVWMS